MGTSIGWLGGSLNSPPQPPEISFLASTTSPRIHPICIFIIIATLNILITIDSPILSYTIPEDTTKTLQTWMLSQPTYARVSPKEVIENYYLRHSFEYADNSFYESPYLSSILHYESTRCSYIFLSERTVEARGKEMSELLDRVDAEQLLKKQVDVPEHGIPTVGLHQMIERLPLDPATDTPRSIVTDSKLVTPSTVTRETVLDEGSIVSTLPTSGLASSLSRLEENPLAVIRFREQAKANFLASGWTEADFNKLVGDEALRQLTADEQFGGDTGALRKLIAMALGEQVHDIVPEAVESTKSEPILDNGCPFHIARAYIDRHSKKS